MAKNAWLAAPIAVVVLHRLASGGGATTATTTLLALAAGTFAALFTLGLILRRLGVRSPMVGVVLAALFWLSAPNLTWPDWIGEAGIEPDPITLGSSAGRRELRRDLIVIMVDDHPSSQALLVDHGYDNAEFQLDLFERGLQVAPEAWSNSSDPLLAVASALSGRYSGTPHNERDRRRLAAMAEGDNPVADVLRDNGYTTTHLGAPSAVAVWFGGPNEGGLDEGRAATVDEVGEAIDTAAAETTPDFVFVHIGGCDTEAAGTVAALDAVVARAVCNNRLIIEVLGHLGDEYPTDPVVVIAGTRGAAIDGDLGDNPAAWPRSAIIRGLGVFSAIRFATDCQQPPDDATVAIIVHHAVACALGVAPDPPMERAVVIKGGPVDPDGELEINLNVLRSSLAGQNSRTSK